jgi:SAM-dependent methyltransferase
MDDVVAPLGSLDAVLTRMSIGRDAEASWACFRETVTTLVRATQANSVLELGGGRFPFFSSDEAHALGVDFTINDISQDELNLAPNGFKTACFDVASPLPSQIQVDEYDVIFSRMVLEHVRDGRMAWANMLRLLRPNGIAFAFVPTLFSPPFVINRLIPDTIGSRILRMIDPHRTPGEVPKFPAYYKLCRGRESYVTNELLKIGFLDARVLPFFGTPYFPAVPLLDRLFASFDSVVKKYEIQTFSSYAYIFARKSPLPTGSI